MPRGKQATSGLASGLHGAALNPAKATAVFSGLRSTAVRISLPGVFAAVLDALTSLTFLTAWIAPRLLGARMVKNLALTMLIEFLVLHSSLLYSHVAGKSYPSRLRRARAMLYLVVPYLLFAAAFAVSLGSMWSIFAFAWLLFSRFAHLWVQPTQAAQESDRMLGRWGVSAVAYVAGAAATGILPLPALGLTPDFAAEMRPLDGGLSNERLQSVFAFGLLYFAFQAWLKYSYACEPRCASPSPSLIDSDAR